MPGKCHFQIKWCSFPDFSDWLQAGSNKFAARCTLCEKEFNIDGSGISQVKSHAKAKSHNEIYKIKKSQQPDLRHLFGTVATPSILSKSYKLHHNNHLTLVLESLAGDESFMDITLTAQGKAIKAHKSVLSAVSPYFRSVLKQNPCQHPIIIMPRDVRFDELSNIISYVYKGEMTVAAEDLSSLLKTAEVLQVTGLSPWDGSSGPGGIMSQIHGLPTGVFPSTSTSSSSSSSKNGTKKASKQTSPTTQVATEETSRSVCSEAQGKIDPLEFLKADMTCVKEEIKIENEETEDSTFGLSMDTSDTAPNPAESVETSPNRRRSLEDPTGKPFNPGEPWRGRTYSEENSSEFPPPTTSYVCPHCLETHRPNDALHSHLRLKHPSKPSFVCACARVFVRQSVFAEHSKNCTLGRVVFA